MEPSGKGWAAFFEKNTMAVRTNIFTLKESELREAALPINAVIRSAREYVALDQQNTAMIQVFRQNGTQATRTQTYYTR